MSAIHQNVTDRKAITQPSLGRVVYKQVENPCVYMNQRKRLYGATHQGSGGQGWEIPGSRGAGSHLDLRLELLVFKGRDRNAEQRVRARGQDRLTACPVCLAHARSTTGLYASYLRKTQEVATVLSTDKDVGSRSGSSSGLHSQVMTKSLVPAGRAFQGATGNTLTPLPHQHRGTEAREDLTGLVSTPTVSQAWSWPKRPST